MFERRTTVAERCGYCGRFMRLVEFGAEYGSEWVCARQDWHIAADPAHWSIGSLAIAIRVAKIRAGLEPDDRTLPALFIEHMDPEWRRPFWERQLDRVLASAGVPEGGEPA